MNKFWETKTLEQMSPDEWESLCDGCGLCCLVKIEDEDSGDIYNTSVSCHLLDIEQCRCRDYVNRLSKVPACAQLNLANLPGMSWLPETCAYKRLYAGQALPAWHPLLTGDIKSVHDAGVSVRRFAQSEEYIHPDQLTDFIIDNF
ncbi:MAG: YcgN family cysteine cluster protein [Gammaproteobacteria bacterium]